MCSVDRTSCLHSVLRSKENPRSVVHVVVDVSLVSFKLEQFLSLSLSFMTLTFLKRVQASCFVECPSV